MITKKNQFSFENLVWKILLDVQNAKILLELRQESSLQTSFAVLDLEENKLLWEKKLLEYGWWWQAVSVAEGVFILKQYKNQGKDPLSRGIWVGKVVDGSKILQEEEWQFEHFAPPLLVIVNEQSQRQDLDLQAYLVKKNTNPEKICYPLQYHQENSYFSILKTLIQKVTQQEAQELIGYCEYREKLFLSYFVQIESNSLQQYLLVLDATNADVLLHENIHTKTYGITTDSFIIWQQQLILIQNRQHLLIYEID